MDAQLIAFGVATFVIAWIGGIAGLVLGNLRLPLTVVLAGSPAVGAGTNLAVSTVAATSASVGHARAQRVDWGLVVWMVPPSAIAAFLAGALAGRAPERLLLVAITGVLLLGAWEIARPGPAYRPPPRATIGRAAAVAAVVGALGGFVGLLLGSLRLPALVRIVGQRLERAVGTNQVVGMSLGLAGLAGHLTGAGVDGALVLAGAIGAAPGGVLGARFAGRLPERQLRHAVVAILVLSALVIAAQIALG